MQVFASLSVISENWGGINEWRSTFVRLRQFEADLFAREQGGKLLGGTSLRSHDGSSGCSGSGSDGSAAEMVPICVRHRPPQPGGGASGG